MRHSTTNISPWFRFVLVAALAVACRPAALDVPDLTGGSPTADGATLPPSSTMASSVPGSPVPTAPAPTSPAPTSGAPVTRAPTAGAPGPTDRPSPGPTDGSPAGSAGASPWIGDSAIPADWTLYRWADRLPLVALPPDWSSADVNEDLASARTNLKSADPASVPTIRRWIELYESGSVRLLARAPLSGADRGSAWLALVIERGDDSLAALEARLVKIHRDVQHDLDVDSRSVITPIGRAVEVRYSPARWPMVGQIDVAIFLPDGRSMSLMAGSSSGLATLDPIVDGILAKLHPWTEPALAFPPAPADGPAAPAIIEAVRRLGELESYRFMTIAANRNPAELDQGSYAIGFRGTLTRPGGPAIGGVLGMAMGGPGSEASVSFGYRVTISPDWIWTTGPNGDRKEPASGTMSALDGFLPEGMAGNVARPFASGFERVGTGEHGGVVAIHYRATAAGLAEYAAATRSHGALTADLWIAEQGGYLVGLDIRSTPIVRPDATPGPPLPADAVDYDQFELRVEITAANDPLNAVILPNP